MAIYGIDRGDSVILPPGEASLPFAMAYSYSLGGECRDLRVSHDGGESWLPYEPSDGDHHALSVLARAGSPWFVRPEG